MLDSRLEADARDSASFYDITVAALYAILDEFQIAILQGGSIILPHRHRRA